MNSISLDLRKTPRLLSEMLWQPSLEAPCFFWSLKYPVGWHWCQSPSVSGTVAKISKSICHPSNGNADLETGLSDWEKCKNLLLL